MGSKPRFSILKPAPSTNPTHWERYSDTQIRYKIKLFNSTGLLKLADETMDVYRIFRNLVAERHRAPSSQKMRITKDEFGLYSDQLMYRLINIIQYEVPRSPNKNPLIFKLFGYAALAHVSTFLCNPARRGSVLELMSTRIRESLEAIDIRRFQVAYPEMMLWIIMIGGLAATGLDAQGWFAELLSELCIAAGIKKKTELALFLSEFLWNDSYIGPLCKVFWDDFSAAQAKKTGNEISDAFASKEQI